ncbi:MAG: hypothetical protein QNJ14_04720 [Woeseiaceae bacterium]|nr:hypothetical protein [Woeseiaceae bacterium]
MRLTLFAIAVSLTLGSYAPKAEAKGADRLFTQACPAKLQTRLQQAKQFLVRYQHRLADDFEIDARGGQERRSHRQILRRVEKIGFKCKMDDGCDTHTALQSVVGGNTIRICSKDLYDPKNDYGAPFWRVVEVVAHEFGHNAHIPRARAGRHNRRGYNDPDKVYQFGFFAAELAREVYGTGFRVGDSRDPVSRPGLVPPYGIVLYPRKNREGHPVGFAVELDDRGGRLDFDRWEHRHSKMDDLRFIGRNNAITSVVVKKGRWQICSKKNLQGTCKVVSANVDNLRSIKMNNKISSLRYLGD